MRKTRDWYRKIKDWCGGAKDWYRSRGKRSKAIFYSAAASLLAGCALCLTVNFCAGRLTAQQMSARWGEGSAQISCFFQSRTDAEGVDILRNSIEEFRHGVDKALEEAAVENTSENPGSRMWIDAFSADGTLVLQSGKARLEAHAIGVGGEFFRFHPLTLLEGNFFSESDNNHDYCVLDEDAAWQLFGSNDVAGQLVNVGGRPLVVSGVIRRDQGRLEKAAGLAATIVYVSYETLMEQGSSLGINHYEIVMPDPVAGFAIKHVREKLGTDEESTVILENSRRYSQAELLKRLLEFGTRSMSRKGIIYPYWENLARGWEDILAPLVGISCVLLLYPLLAAVGGAWYGWTHRSRTVGEILRRAGDAWEKRKRRRRSISDGRGEEAIYEEEQK